MTDPHTWKGNGAPTSRRTALKLLGGSALATAFAAPASAADPVKVGLSAAFSGPNAAAGQAMQRGADLAMAEINAAGGVLGRQLSLVIRDNEHKLDRGVAQTRELIERENCAAILGSQGSFIGLAVIDTIHELKVPWFALSVGGVGIIENNRQPNYMFRVATNDREVAKFLVNYGLDKAGSKTFANTVEVANALKAGNKIGYKPRVISAWALANATFPSLASGMSDGVMVMQTFTFVENKRPQAVALFKRLTEKYTDVKDPMAVTFPSFLGNAYDATHMIALAIKKAQSTEGPKLQAALENLGAYDGLVKSYSNPFSASNHEALGPSDYLMTAWKGTRLEL